MELTLVFKSERSRDAELKTRSRCWVTAASCDAELWFLQVTNGIRNEWQDQNPSPRSWCGSVFNFRGHACLVLRRDDNVCVHFWNGNRN